MTGGEQRAAAPAGRSTRASGSGRLAGRGIVVTRPRERAAALAGPLAAAGARVWIAPVIRTAPPSTWVPLDRALDRLAQYEWVVLTSAEGVDALVGRLLEREMDARSLAGLRIAVIGRKTALRLGERGLRPDLVPDEYRAEALAEALIGASVAGRTVLVPRSARAREVLVEMLVAAGAFVDEVPSYTIEPEERLPEELLDALAEGVVDMVTFTSPSTVQAFLDLARRCGAENAVAGLAVGCIGPVTAGAAREHGLEPAVVAREYTVEGLLGAVEEHYGGSDGGSGD